MQIKHLHPLCCKSQSSPKKHAPWENPSMPSYGPVCWTKSSINLTLSSKPIAGPPLRIPLKVLSSLLKNQPYCSEMSFKIMSTIYNITRLQSLK